MSSMVRIAIVSVGLVASSLLSASLLSAQTAPLASAPGSVMSLAALKQVEAGLWQLDVKGRVSRQMCVADPMAFVQIEHDQPGCSRFVIANEAKLSTVHYSCQRSGWGRTTVRVESPRQASIQTQGIAGNAPFDYAVTARRIGDCNSQTAARQR